jgi:hypothetical protein
MREGISAPYLLVGLLGFIVDLPLVVETRELAVAPFIDTLVITSLMNRFDEFGELLQVIGKLKPGDQSTMNWRTPGGTSIPYGSDAHSKRT